MSFNIYAVKDNLTGKFLQPIFVPTEEEALRLFKLMINDTPLWKSNPSHFDLWKIGLFDDEKGIEDWECEMVQGGTSIVERT